MIPFPVVAEKGDGTVERIKCYKCSAEFAAPNWEDARSHYLAEHDPGR